MTSGYEFTLEGEGNSPLLDFDIHFYDTLESCLDGHGLDHTNGESDEKGKVPIGATVGIVILWAGPPGSSFVYREAPAAPLPQPPRHQGPDRPITVIAVVDAGFSPYHFDFVGHKHPWNTDSDPDNDFDFYQNPSDYITGFPGAQAIDLTIPALGTQTVSELRANDKDEWSKFKASTADEANLFWFPGTKIIGAIDFEPFEPAFFDTNDGHGTRSASVAGGNIHGSCPECLFVLIRGGEPESLAWAARQPWIDVITNSYGHSLSGGLVRDNIYFGQAIEATKVSSDEGQFVVFSAGNGLLNAFDVPMLTYWSSEKGPDWMITVGAAAPNHEQQYSGAGKPVDLSSIGSSYPASGGSSVEGQATHSGTSNAAPVTAGTLAKVIQAGKEKLGDRVEGHDEGILSSGQSVTCGDANPTCVLSDGILTRAEVQDLVFYNVLPSPSRIVVNTVWPSTEYSYYYQGHGVISGRSQGQAEFNAEQTQFLKALTGEVSYLPRPEGEMNWFVIDSKCRQRLWGDWSGGYFNGVDPQLTREDDPIAYSFNEWCSRTRERMFADIADIWGNQEPPREDPFWDLVVQRSGPPSTEENRPPAARTLSLKERSPRETPLAQTDGQSDAPEEPTRSNDVQLRSGIHTRSQLPFTLAIVTLVVAGSAIAANWVIRRLKGVG